MDRNNLNKYKVIVIGAGIAGAEAALVCAKKGIKTLIINISMDNTATLKYSSKFGGAVRASLIKELELLGVSLKEAISFSRMAETLEKINDCLSPAYIVDKKSFSLFYKYNLETMLNLETRQGLVSEIIKIDLSENEKYKIILNDGSIFYSEKIIISPGTFLNGRISWGNNIINAGRHGEITSNSLAENLENIGFEFKKTKTHISPRIDKKTIDLKKIKKVRLKDFKEKSLNNEIKDGIHKENIFCYKTKAKKDLLKKRVEILCAKENHKRLTGDLDYIQKYLIENIQDDNFINDFMEISLIPEGVDTKELYADGFLTELPDNDQQKIINEFSGLENALLTRPGYSIEYDILKTGQLGNTLKSKINNDIYFAGEVNGTAGYEESAAQGFVAGINASLNILGEKEILFEGENTLIGFLIDTINSGNLYPPFKISFEKELNCKNFRYEDTETRISKYLKILKRSIL